MKLDNEFNILQNSKFDVTQKLIRFDKLIQDQIYGLNSIIITDLSFYYKETDKVRIEYKKSIIKRLGKLITNGQNLGVFRSDLDAYILANIRITQIENCLVGDSKDFFRNEYDSIYKHFVQGIQAVTTNLS